MRKNIWIAGFLFLFIIFLDQFTKYLIVSLLDPYRSVAITSFSQLIFVKNTGISFGLFKNYNSFFIIMIPILLLSILYLMYINRMKRMVILSLISIFAGAVGNLYDRIFRGYVVDFFDFFYQEWHWPAFNVADTCIVFGMLLFFYVNLCSD